MHRRCQEISRRDLARRLQIAGAVRKKAVKIGLPLDVVDKGNKQLVPREQWAVVANVFKVLLTKNDGNSEKAKAAFMNIADAPKDALKRAASYWCDECETIHRIPGDNPQCPGDKAHRLRTIASAK